MYKKLKDFLEKDMRMSHIYQPVMIKTLLKHGGSAEISRIAQDLLSYDTSQKEYYELVTKNMVGKVLTKNRKITSKEGSKYCLDGFDKLSKDQQKSLIKICDLKISEYIQKRGERIWSHRHLSNDPIPGSIRYEVLKRAKGKCELCGISNKEKSLDVDHIIPRSKGGSNDISNLQSLCYTCNRQKRNLDDADLRDIGKFFEYREEGCVFCNLKRKKIEENEFAFAIKDNFPVTKGHHLVIPKRHVSDYFDLEQSEINSINKILFSVKHNLEKKDKTITGFNIGINSGVSAGQTIFHCHIHLIPRRDGDVKDPRGGVRGVIPEKQKLDAAVDFVKTLESMGVEESEIKAIGEYDPKLEEAVSTVFEEYEEDEETYDDRYEDD